MSGRARFVAGSLVGLGVLLGACTASDTPRTPPTIAAVTPPRGPSLGGASITIAGTNLDSGSELPVVVVGDQQAEVVSATAEEIVFTAPPGAEGEVVDVTVFNRHGFTTSDRVFTFNPLPVVLAITPAGGTAAGGSPITITGRGFADLDAGAATIEIGGGTATAVQVVDDKTITALTGPTAPGTPAFTALDVHFTNANGPATLAAAFSTTKQGLLLLSRNEQVLSFFDPGSKDIKQITQLPLRLHSCALGPDGLIYATGRNAMGAQSLHTIDPLTGVTTTLGVTTAGGPQPVAVSAIVFVGDTLLGYGDGPPIQAVKRLVTLDPATGAASIIGTTAITTLRGAAIGNRDQNTVFFAETTSGSLDTLTISTSTRVTGPTMSGGLGSKVRALINSGGKLLLLEDGAPSVLYSVDTVSGVLTPVSSVINYGVGVCQTPPTF